MKIFRWCGLIVGIVLAITALWQFHMMMTTLEGAESQTNYFIQFLVFGGFAYGFFHLTWPTASGFAFLDRFGLWLHRPRKALTLPWEHLMGFALLAILPTLYALHWQGAGAWVAGVLALTILIVGVVPFIKVLNRRAAVADRLTWPRIRSYQRPQ